MAQALDQTAGAIFRKAQRHIRFFGPQQLQQRRQIIRPERLNRAEMQNAR